jgi:hypothetical protein
VEEHLSPARLVSVGLRGSLWTDVLCPLIADVQPALSPAPTARCPLSFHPCGPYDTPKHQLPQVTQAVGVKARTESGWDSKCTC